MGRGPGVVSCFSGGARGGAHVSGLLGVRKLKVAAPYIHTYIYVRIYYTVLQFKYTMCCLILRCTFHSIVTFFKKIKRILYLN